MKESGAAVTEERTRIACEIHDGLVQNLAGSEFQTRSLSGTGAQGSAGRSDHAQ